VFRTGLSKVGIPGADIGLRAEDPTIAELLKPLGYATGQFGKNHLGDKNQFLPTVHGFDEFFGNLYHLNAEEEPELPDYPSNEIISHHDWLPTLLAAADDPDIVQKLKAWHAIGDRTFRVHIDGYNFLPYLTGEADKGPRPGFVYFSDDGDLVALRYDNFKMVFMEQRAAGTLQIWAEPFVILRVPKMFNLRTDPFERADTTSNTYWDWMLDHAFLAIPAQSLIGEFLATFAEFPPRQRAASFTIDQALEKLEAALTALR
jgi:arylsulfatase A-like enzyme